MVDAGDLVEALRDRKYIIHNTIQLIQLIRIIHNTGGWICIILYFWGYSWSRSRRLLLLSAITIRLSVHMCVWAYVVYICVLRYKTIATHMIDDIFRH
jgi:hypothetical protein